jgi:hypothetical protein
LILGSPTVAYFLAVDFTSGSYLSVFLLILMSALLIAIFLSLRHTAQDGNRHNLYRIFFSSSGQPNGVIEYVS